MIRWLRRKKKKDQGEEGENIRETETREEEEMEEEETLAEETLTRAVAPEPEAADKLETETGMFVSEAGMEAAPEEEEEDEAPEEGAPKRGFFKRLRQRLKGTREKFVRRIDRLVLGKKIIDEDLLDQLEEILITSDLGVRTTGMLLGKVADKVKRKELSDPARLRGQIREEIKNLF